MNSPRILLLCMQIHVCMPVLISPFSGLQWRGSLLFQIGLRLFLIVFLFGVLCFCFKTRTSLSLLLCLPLYWFLPLHPLDLLVGLLYKKLSKFTCTLSLLPFRENASHYSLYSQAIFLYFLFTFFFFLCTF